VTEDVRNLGPVSEVVVEIVRFDERDPRAVGNNV
jgi:hypothetical protein